MKGNASFRVQCPHCGSRLTAASPALLGRPVACPACRRTFIAAAPAPAPARGGSHGLLFGAAAVAAVLVAVCLVLVGVVLALGRREPAGQLASNDSARETRDGRGEGPREEHRDGIGDGAWAGSRAAAAPGCRT